MKLVDMTPGLVYAVPANRMNGSVLPGGTYGYGGSAQVRDGDIAVPFRLDRVGKFRSRRAGACATEIVEDYHATTLVGSFPDLQAMLGKSRPENEYKRPYYRGRRAHGYNVAANTWPGYPGGVSLRGKKFVWHEQQVIIMPVDIIMPWADFLTRREEWVFVATEIAAYQARYRELLAQVRAAVDPCLDVARHEHDGSVDIRVPNGQRLTYDSSNILFTRSYKTQVALSTLPSKVKATIAPMLKEMAGIQKKLECAV